MDQEALFPKMCPRKNEVSAFRSCVSFANIDVGHVDAAGLTCCRSEIDLRLCFGTISDGNGCGHVHGNGEDLITLNSSSDGEHREE